MENLIIDNKIEIFINKLNHLAIAVYQLVSVCNND